VKLVFSKNNIDIIANTPDVGEAQESLAVQLQGQGILRRVQSRSSSWRRCARSPNDEVFLDLIDEMSPGVIKIQSPFLYVLMPMRIS
jgi:DNA polymerase-3 subunit beta